MSEGSDEIVNSLRQGHVNYVINTMELAADHSRRDGYFIRRTAVDNNITVFTSLETVAVLLDVLDDITMKVSTIDED